jgi:hypothetical protein
MRRSWTHRKGAEFEREVQRRLAEVFGGAFVRRGVKSRARAAPADVVAPRLWIECKAQRRTNPRGALRQATGGADVEERWAVAVCKDDGKAPLVMMRFEDFVALLREWHGLRVRSR